MIVFAAGNKYKIEAETLHYNEINKRWYAWGIRWVKSKQAWPSPKSRGLFNWTTEPIEIKDEE